MHNPLVSVLIPTYNRQDFILECINSALNQSYKNIEIIISDNCSTDQTLDICKAAGQKDPRIKVVSTHANLGPVANWLNCFKNSSGQYIKLLFSDDLLLPDCIERMVVGMQDPGVGVVYSSVLIGASIDHAVTHYRNISGQCVKSKSIYKKLLLNQIPVSPCSMMFRRHDFERNLHMNFPSKTPRNYSQNGAGPDVMMAILTAELYEFIYYIDEPQVFFRAHKTSLTIANLDNDVNNGYSSAICWYAYCKVKSKYIWALFIYKYWLKQILFSKKIVSLRDYMIAHEGSGEAKELFILIFAMPCIFLECLLSKARNFLRIKW